MRIFLGFAVIVIGGLFAMYLDIKKDVKNRTLYYLLGFLTASLSNLLLFVDK